MSGYPVAPPGLKAARQVLATGLLDSEVGTKMPDERPAKFVRVSRAGGQRPVIVTDTVRLLVEVWARTVAVAEQTVNEAIAVLQNAQGTRVEGAFIRGFDNIQGPVDLPDPDVTDMERWQFLGDFHVSTS